MKNKDFIRSQKNDEYIKLSVEFEKIKDKRNKITEAIEQAEENMKIFHEVISERKRFLISSYLMRGQDDLEKLLQTLNDHFYLI